jgi:cytochrome P450
MGIPEWHAGNVQPDFYDDPQVFRPARPLTKAG